MRGPLPFIPFPSRLVPPLSLLLASSFVDIIYRPATNAHHMMVCIDDVAGMTLSSRLQFNSSHMHQLDTRVSYWFTMCMWLHLSCGWHLQSFITWASIWSQMSAYVLKLHLQSRIALEFSGSRQSYCNDNQQLTFLGATLYVLCTKYVNTTFRTLYEVLRVKKF